MILSNGDRQYGVGDLVAETPLYRLYLCSTAGSNDIHLLQVAADVAHSGELDRAAYLIEYLVRYAGQLEEEYARVKGDPKDMLNYQFCLPQIIDTFVSAEQGDRRINILGFHNVDDARRMVPLHTIVHKDHRRVDLRTSVWIMGKLLKILTFVHDAGVSIGDISTGNILIEPDQHYVVVFNWADARKHQDGVPSSVVRREIANAAESVLSVLGATAANPVPYDGSAEFSIYLNHVLKLAADGDRSAEEAHRAFYALADRLWPRG